jgi:trimethylamine:corrinoid methyltransferase-like protein
MRRKQRVKIEIREAAIGHAGGQKFPQAARLDGAERANFFEYHAAQRVLENAGIEQFANFGARAAFNQHGAKKTQRIPLKKCFPVCFWNGHTSPFFRGLPG